MLMTRKSVSGFTLIELMFSLILLAILLTIGAPSLSRWVHNRQIRTSAEAIHNGLMLAKTEAVRRNAAVRFQLTTTTTSGCVLSDTGTSWVVSLDSPAGACDAAPSDTAAPRIIQSRSSSEGSPNAVVNAGGVSTLTFNSVGQTNASATINVSNPNGGSCTTDGGSMRCLRVTVSSGGQIRMCDPARPNTDPQGC